jgi:translation initiation factor 2 alpha subunit (eIF-2alpha)
MEYNEGDLIICKVINIAKTTVFVETLSGVQGSMVLSEIAPGRIRNLRVYVVPNKIIVCKVLHVKGDHLFLSLRRVKEKDRKELMAQYKKEKTYESVIRKLLGNKADET